MTNDCMKQIEIVRHAVSLKCILISILTTTIKNGCKCFYSIVLLWVFRRYIRATGWLHLCKILLRFHFFLQTCAPLGQYNWTRITAPAKASLYATTSWSCVNSRGSFNCYEANASFKWYNMIWQQSCIRRPMCSEYPHNEFEPKQHFETKQ